VSSVKSVVPQGLVMHEQWLESAERPS